RVTEQCLLTAVCQNIKKMTLLLWKRNNGPQGGSFIRLFFSIFFQLAYKPSGFSAGFVNSLTGFQIPVFLFVCKARGMRRISPAAVFITPHLSFPETA
ncbi:hypothetical protein, partial [Planifilum fimeticola]|uniref:hypothetical protein n=1 Tax=Planifilum fimeticola TaxID=201975 RepID=UPI001B80375B